MLDVSWPVKPALVNWLVYVVTWRSAYVPRQLALLHRDQCLVACLSQACPLFQDQSCTSTRARGHISRHLPPALSMLQKLQLAHVKGIPFENLSLHHPTAVQNKEFHQF
ncbi:TPA: hypothetical protein ACH3X1_009705 [Trebouxia sp. C0004]